MQRLEQLCDKYFGTHGRYEFEHLTGSGSNRQYYRIKLSNKPLAIGVIGTSVDENRAFCTIAGHFKRHELPVPELYAVSNDGMCYIQQDLGNETLFDVTGNARKTGVYSDNDIKLLKRTITTLPSLQYRGARGFDFSVCYPQQAFDERMISFDLNYFKYCFLKTTGIDFQEIALDDDFRLLTAHLMSCMTDTFMHRDFQSRNVLIYNGNPYFIDFQGGRRGPVYYDVASFIWQARASYPEALREELVNAYLEALAEYTTVDEMLFRKRLQMFVLFRTLQVLGAYGFRGYFEKKEHFLLSIPFAISNLKSLLSGIENQYPYLHQVLARMVNLPKFSEKQIPEQSLEVEIYSFSYKKGIPDDKSGNGGGYVFDCRGIHNPGRYEEYKKLNGQDQEVISFLEQHRDVFFFLDSVYSLLDRHIERYIQRGFTHLLVSFGCTGGQHRSVYCAGQCAEHIRNKYPGVNVKLIHREQNIVC
ncbi:MAG: phosphotransferase [Candidatus Aphodosoma sp.]